MKTHLFCLLLALIASPGASGQSYENIKIFPLGAVPDSLYRAGCFRKVLPFARQAVEHAQAQQPFDTILYAKAVYRLGEIEQNAGYYKDANEHLKTAFSIYEKKYGLNDDTAARMCWMFGWSQMRNIKWAEADSMLTWAIEHSEKNTHITEYAKAALLGVWGNIRHNQRKYKDAERAYLEALRRWENIHTTETEEYAYVTYVQGSLNNLSERYTESMACQRKAIAIWQKIYSNTHPILIFPLNGIGFTYKKQGDLFRAKDYFTQALHLAQKMLGPDYWYAGILWYNLSTVHLDLGDYEQAEKALKESLPIIERTVGKGHSDYPMLLALLGSIHRTQGEYAEAEQLFSESRLLRANILTTKHPHYAEATGQLASLFLEKNEPEKALPLLEEALSIQIEIDGAQHTSVAKTLQQIAVCHAQQGEFEKADSLLNATSEMFKRIFGNQGAEIARNMELRTLVNLRREERSPELENWVAQAHALRRDIAHRATAYTTGRELESLLISFASHNALVYRAAEEAGMTKTAFDNALLFKNFALQARSEISSQAANSGNPQHTQAFSNWQNIQRKLSAELAKPVQARLQTDSLERELQRIESYFSNEFASYSEKYRSVTWQEVQSALAPGEAVVEFVHFSQPDLKKTDSVRYAALVLLPRDTAPHFVPLFEEKKLAHLLENRSYDSASIAALYTRSGRLLDKRPTYGAEMHRLIWQPLENLLRSAKTVYFSPSGLLHRINLAAIPIGKKGKVLADRHTLRLMSSTRALAMKTSSASRLTPAPNSTNGTAALYGGIQYGSDSANLSQHTMAYRGVAHDAAFTHDAAEYLASTTRDTSKTWAYLEGTLKEVESLRRRMSASGLHVRAHTGFDATEESIKACGQQSGSKSPDVLHIATHGFFFPDAQKPPASSAMGEGQEGAVFRWNQNPLFRSGLVLAGAERTWQTGRPFANLEDGILTAHEISHLNLSNTRLAVLSACETGLGDIKGSEGVYGLQRAFKMAGVDYLIVSLWKVPDAQTVEFMNIFYKKWLGGAAIHTAFAAAQKKMRKKYDVYEWGAWVLIE